MTMTLPDPGTEQPSTTPSQRLRWTTTAVRVSLRWLGVRKTLTPEQKTEAALSFGAEGEFLSARKKLLDTRHPAYQEVTAVRGKVLAYWKAVTLPYPEPGIRLLRHNEVEVFHEKLVELRTELQEAVARLDAHYAELKQTARQRLGRLYNPADYPPVLQGLFALDWEFPSVEPPDYLLQLSPALYEQERNRVTTRFEEAVQLAEQAFLSEFAKLVSHLSERLSTDESGTRKVFRDTAITNLLAFFDRFGQLNVRSNTELEALIEQAQQIVQGVEPQQLRDQDSLRQHVATQLSGVQALLDGLLLDQPRRRIIRSTPSGNGASHAADH
jgi:hypothetical protein